MRNHHLNVSFFFSYTSISLPLCFSSDHSAIFSPLIHLKAHIIWRCFSAHETFHHCTLVTLLHRVFLRNNKRKKTRQENKEDTKKNMIERCINVVRTRSAIVNSTKDHKLREKISSSHRHSSTIIISIIIEFIVYNNLRNNRSIARYQITTRTRARGQDITIDVWK